MFKLTLVILLLSCQHMIGQIVPALEGKPLLNFSTQSDTIPNWLRAIHLMPNECLMLKRPKVVDYIYLPLLLNFRAAIPKAVLMERKDSLFKAAGLFVKAMRKTLHLNKTSKVVISFLYFDRYRCNGGVSRSLVYFINGRKTIITDTTYDDSSLMDSAISSRVEAISLAPNQYILVDHEKQALTLCNIEKQCDKDEPLPGYPLYTRARMAALTLLFKALQRDFAKYKAVAYACVDPLGARKLEATGYEFDRMDLLHLYDVMYQDYLLNEKRFPQ